ncbi:hypothetical protein EJB05_04688, partial [Eragrostis curvula]
MGNILLSCTCIKLQLMMSSLGSSSASSRRHHSANLADHRATSSSMTMKFGGLIIVAWQIPMLGVEVEGAVDVEGVGVEEAMVVMVDMETTKGATTKAVDTMIIKVDMADMIIKAGMVVVDMATTKADMETTKKMVAIAEAEVVCVEEETIITVVANEGGRVDMEAGAAMKEAGEGMKEAGEGIEEAGEAMKVAGAAMREAGMGMKEAGAAVFWRKGVRWPRKGKNGWPWARELRQAVCLQRVELIFYG